MSDHTTLNRLLRMIVLLAGNRNYERTEIAERIGVDERTVYRYLNTLEDAGLVLHRENGRYRLVIQTDPAKSIGKLFHFSREEAYLLGCLLEKAEGEGLLRNRLLQKLHALYDFNALAQLEGHSTLEHIAVLREAITRKKQAALRAYRSSHSHTIEDRQVEPFGFLPDYEAVWCFDHKDKKNKQFRLSRIHEVKLLEERWKYEDRHRMPFTDAFRLSAEAPKGSVQLKMNLNACNLLKEEYPAAYSHLQPAKDGFLLDVPVADYRGIGRFVLGLPGDISDVGPEDFRDFLRKQVKKLNTVTEVVSGEG